MNFSEKFIYIFRLLLPNPFTIAILLSLIASLLALGLTSADPNSSLPHLFQIGQYWEQGFWDLLSFTTQMMLILVLGHALALSPIISKMIYKIASICNNTSRAALFVSLTTITLGFVNWGLALIVGAVLARKVGESAAKQNISLNYPLVGAAGYLGMLVWHGGLSGSATLKVTEANHFLASEIGQIPVSDTIFSPLNISVSLLLLIIIPILFYAMGKLPFNHSSLPSPHKTIPDLEESEMFGAEKLDHSRWFGKLFGLLMLMQVIYLIFIKPDRVSLDALNLNLINFLFFGLGLFCFKNISAYLKALEDAIVGSVGILIQFPLYAGIAGIIKYSGLIHVFSDFIVNMATPVTYPIFTLFSAALVNIFVPSGGGQWAVQGPILVEAAKSLNASVPTGILAFAYGDQLTNMLQPFWALPLLGITKLKAYEIVPYTLITMLVATIIFCFGLLVFV